MMKTIRKLKATISASFDTMISQIENHDALVQSTLSDIQQAAGRAHAQLARVKRDGDALRKRQVEVNEQVTAWTERAVKIGNVDKTRALECLKRKRRLEAEHRLLAAQIEEHERTEHQLQKDLELIEEKLAVLKRQHRLLKTRQTRAEALRTLRHDDSLVLSDIDDTFGRWESKVLEYEYAANCGVDSRDKLEEAFRDQEADSSLQEELQKLLEQHN